MESEPLPDAEACIFTVELYKYNPWELTEMYPTLARDEWYFFTWRERRYPNGTRPSRAAGDIYWKATVADQRVYHNKECIGFKKTLVFFQGKALKGEKTNWIMHEYTLRPTNNENHNNNNLDDCVLCRIHERNPAAAAPPLVLVTSLLKILSTTRTRVRESKTRLLKTYNIIFLTRVQKIIQKLSTRTWKLSPMN